MYFRFLYTNLFFLCFFVQGLFAQNIQVSKYSIHNGLPHAQVNDVAQDSLGYLWLATNGGGIARFDGDQFDIWNEKKGLLSNYATTISIIDGDLYIGTTKGFSIKTKTELFSYKGEQVNKILKVNNQLFLATNKGLRVFENLDTSLFPLNKIIDTSLINDILFDGHFLWIASNKGLWSVSRLNTSEVAIKKIHDFATVSLTYAENNLFVATKTKGFLRLTLKIITLKKLIVVRESMQLYIINQQINYL